MAGKDRKTQIEAMLTEDPNDPFLNYGLAMEYVSSGDDDGAVRRFQHLFEVAPDYVPGYLQAGQAFNRLNRLNEARSILQRGLDVARKKGDTHAFEEMSVLLSTLA